MLELVNVTKSYGSRRSAGGKIVLSRVSLKINPGDKIGILGKNGAGKSTLVRIISGADKPDSGEINRGMSVSWPLAFGDAFQGGLTGIDNVRLISRVYNARYEDVIGYVKEFSELGRSLADPIKTYSTGMRARLAFAISMAIDFDCFLIDEVIAVGDESFRRKCDVELFEKRASKSMIIVSHDTEIIERQCNKAAILRDGCLTLYENVGRAVEDHRFNLLNQVK